MLTTRTSNQFISACINREGIDIEYIVKSNLFQPLSIEDYARLCLRSLASFKRDFKKQFNVSPKQWINQQRILHSAKLLNTTNKTVNEIAFDCGFQSTSHFIKLFKSQFGYTPKANGANIVTI
ncbi:MAG: helix-turn-helix transcriptional regulator [Bacteroidales bacterium]|nr:helix-turn-helix transcriptional regulator [Bacteroidales bacterium]